MRTLFWQGEEARRKLNAVLYMECSAKYRENVDDLFRQAAKQALTATRAPDKVKERGLCALFWCKLMAVTDWLTSVYTQTARPDTFPVWFSLQLQFPGIHPFPVTAFPYRGPRELKPIPVGIERGQVTRQIITGRLQSSKYILCVFPCPVLFLYLHANVQTCCLKNEYNLTYHLTCVLFSYGQQQKHLGDFLNRRKLQLHELLTSHRSKTYNTVFTKKKKNHFKEVQWHKQWNISIYSNIHGVE